MSAEPTQTTTHETFPPTHKNFGCVIKPGLAMNDKWITDREPKKSDADDQRRVWTMFMDKPTQVGYWHVEKGRPWMPIVPPEPYVKPNQPYVEPKRFEVRWEHYGEAKGCWMVFTTAEYGQREVLTLKGLTQNNDEHREAAERIAAIYEEVMP